MALKPVKIEDKTENYATVNKMPCKDLKNLLATKF